MSAQSRDQWAEKFLTSTLRVPWYSSDPQARRVADAAAVEVERLQAAKTKAEEAELAAAQKLDEVKAERDALAAHVARIIKAWNADEDTRELFTAEWIDCVGDVVEDAPITSLARIKAEWQAEALELFASSIRSENDEGRSADLYGMASLMEVSASQFRRQAEEARDE